MILTNPSHLQVLIVDLLALFAFKLSLARNWQFCGTVMFKKKKKVQKLIEFTTASVV